MQTGRRLPHRPLNEKPKPGPGTRRAGAEPQFLHPVTSPAPSPLHRPHGNIAVPASRQSCRARNAASSPLLRRSDHASKTRSSLGVRRVAPPSPPSRCGCAPGRAPAPLAHGGRPFPPALVALARALLRACAHPRASVVCGVAHRTKFIFPRPRPRCGPVARPHRDGGARRRSAPWPCPHSGRKKTKATMGRGLGWWWRRV